MAPQKDHFENRGQICCHCGRKRGLRDAANHADLIKSLLVKDYDYNSPMFPNMICATCRNYLNDKKKDPNSTGRRPPPPLKYEELFPRSSRSTGLFDPKPGERCDCALCDIARLTLDYPQFHQQHSRHPGNAPLPPPTPPPPMIVCSYCYSPYGPGKKHECSKSTLQGNLVSAVRQKSVNTQEKVVSKTLKSIATDQEVTTRGGSVQLTTAGPNKLRVVVGKRRNEDRENPKVSNEFMMQLQNTISCSDLDTLKIGRCFRVFFGQRNMEPGLKAALTRRNRSLEDIFRVEQVEFETTKDEETVIKPAVVADVPALITLLLHERELDPSHHQLHIGLDGGQDVLKVLLLVCQAVGDEPPEKRAGDFKLTSAKKIMIIGAVHGVDENYSNVKTLLEKLDLESIGDHPFAVDIKMMLILCGKQSASSRHSCPYCEGSGDFSESYEPYTLGSLKSHLDNFRAAGSVKRKAKDYSNVTRPALITGSDSDRTLELLNFPSLHVLTGVTGKIVNEMVKSIIGGELFISTFMDKNRIKWADYRPETFEGNQARKFVKLSSKLEVEARKIRSIPSAVRAIHFAKTLRLFNNVVEACFGQELDLNFREKILRFEDQYRMLDISVTPKVHMVFSHISDFLKLKDYVSGLGQWTEQAMESAHSEFKKEWNLKRLDAAHSNFGDNFLQTVIRFNSKHV